MAISAISEECRDPMISELDKVLKLVVPSLRDPHPRVQFAGCSALGQMTTDFAGPMGEKDHQVVLTTVIPVLEARESGGQAHAAAALVNFCEEAEKSMLEPYLDQLLGHLLQLLQSPKRFVQEQALSTIAIETIRQVIAQEVEMDLAENTETAYLSNLGMDSLMALTVLSKLHEHHGIDLDPTILANNPSLGHLRKALCLEKPKVAPPTA
ncbi:hypothetical protein AYL99_11802 [Fonsecaea erecta]|uniref:Carrier domain-containing protein n=1 Tax=Fonsecaea erecta TaxID=1367422 RepID=A0A178Z2P5_9EURO|nr:hypothetical protein AYL99_11802 [Fonsecaea erecta]OAP54042.1 hypothetical protein AYL99_11802 [Fonsecaea erecta]